MECLIQFGFAFDRYYRMFEATQDGLGKNAPVHSIHGSLLAVGELLRYVKTSPTFFSGNNFCLRMV